MTDFTRMVAQAPNRGGSSRATASAGMLLGLASACLAAATALAPVPASAAATITSACSSGPPAGATTSVTEISASAPNQRVVSVEGKLSGVPDYGWWYGCSATAAGMLMAYYDRNGYGGHDFSNLVPGTIAGPSTYPTTLGTWAYPVQNSIASTGHVANFYQRAAGGPTDPYNQSGDDKPTGRAFDSLADFMGTSQDNLPYSGGTHSNQNGATTFLYYYSYYANDPTTLYAIDGTQSYISSRGDQPLDGGYGMWEYFVNQGYDGSTARVSTKYLDDYVFTSNNKTYRVEDGFTYNDFVSEIYNGRPAIIQTENHSMLGYGWKANFLEQELCLTKPDGSYGCVWQVIDRQFLIDVHDTWTAGDHLMEWGGSYGGANQVGVTTFDPYVMPEPASFGIMLAALGVLAAAARTRKTTS